MKKLTLESLKNLIIERLIEEFNNNILLSKRRGIIPNSEDSDEILLDLVFNGSLSNNELEKHIVEYLFQDLDQLTNMFKKDLTFNKFKEVAIVLVNLDVLNGKKIDELAFIAVSSELQNNKYWEYISEDDQLILQKVYLNIQNLLSMALDLHDELQNICYDSNGKNRILFPTKKSYNQILKESTN